MRKPLPVFLSFVLLGALLCTSPLPLLAGPSTGASRLSGSSLDDCQKRFAETLRSIERERRYTVDKARYQQALADRCTGRKWYDLGLVECILLVPLCGVILPVFGIALLGGVRSRWRISPTRPRE